MPKSDVVKVRQLTRWQRIGVASLFVAGALFLGGIVFILSGIYNIGAAREHWSATNFIITILRDRSISVASNGVEVPNLNDSDLYLLGAQLYDGGCNTCHGVPGRQLNPVYRNMLPQPPDLSGAFSDYSARELFWIVNNGLKYTGMPAWPGEGRSDEVWSVVAHLAKLHELGPDNEPRQEPTLPVGKDIAGLGTLPLENCVRCHGDGKTGTVSALVPQLQNLSLPYLVRALEEYRAGTRSSGIMEPIAYEMTDAEIERLTRYYADLPSVQSPAAASPALLERGREIAEQGIPEQDLPRCSSCHNGTDPQIPRLENQSARYLDNQLNLWRETSYRDTLPYGSLMANIGKRMTQDDARAVSAWYASLPPVRGVPQ
ncbi:cytochrome c [Devosia pacifica]|uniref:Cytochrome c n=1 Tax=Devosia pacifica TaxID=1335967 RepID=A0A918VXG7_9HYPH|nr:c-type cytochrome [Devosia pacifica]GHA38728.1 cytochrome c [Devosia pacifica]